MTAFNMWTSGDRAFILNDTAQYLPTGEVVDFVQKTVIVKSLKVGSMALTTTGRAGFSQVLQMFYDDLKPRHPLEAVLLLPELLALFEKEYNKHARPGFPCIAGVGAALFCPDMKRPVLLLASNVTAEIIPAPYEPFTVVETGFFLTGNGAYGPFDPDVPYAGCAGFDPERDGLAMIEAQRREKFPESDVYGIGGEAVLTTISARGVTSKVLQTWPDRVGEKIQPELMPA